MIKINLLPSSKRIKPSALKYDLYLLIFIFVIVMAVAGGIYYKNMQDIAHYKNLIEKTKQDIASLQGIYNEYLAMEREKKEIQRRITAINKVKDGRVLAARTLYDLTSSIQESVWLKSFKKTDDKFELEGRALGSEPVSDFVDSISKIPYIKNVELKNVQDVTEEGLILKKFIILGNISL
jgi:Tfp pilus assembly protein PilN